MPWLMGRFVQISKVPALDGCSGQWQMTRTSRGQQLARMHQKAPSSSWLPGLKFFMVVLNQSPLIAQKGLSYVNNPSYFACLQGWLAGGDWPIIEASELHHRSYKVTYTNAGDNFVNGTYSYTYTFTYTGPICAAWCSWPSFSFIVAGNTVILMLIVWILVR